MNNKLLSFFAAIGIAIAALATPSASAIGAYVNVGTTDRFGIHVNATMSVVASGGAIDACQEEELAGDVNACDESGVVFFENICFASYTAIIPPATTGGASGQAEVRITTLLTKEAVEMSLSMACPDENACTNVPSLAEVDICDSTCAGMDNMVAEEDANIAGCRAVTNTLDCTKAAMRDEHDRIYINEDAPGTCRAALSCTDDNEFQDGAGSCSSCPDNSRANGTNDSCVCNRNTEIYDADRDSCEVCPDGSFVDDAGARCVCTGNNILDADGEMCMSCSGEFPIADEDEDFCRLPNKNSECAELDSTRPVHDPLVYENEQHSQPCRPRMHTDCEAGMIADVVTDQCNLPNTNEECQIVSDAAAEGDDAKNKTIYDREMEACRPPNQAECVGNTPILEGDICRPATDVTECIEETPNTPVFNNGRCLPVETKSSAIGKPILLGVSALAVWAFYTAYVADAGAISWTPSYAFNNNNGNISYSVGSRWTAAANNWRFYWQTAQSGGNADGGLGYGSGMHYNSGIFSARFDSIGNSDTADWDLSLSAQKTSGLWHVGGGYNFGLQLSAEDETDTQNNVNIAARYSLDKWLLSATANTDGDTTAAKVNYSYRF